MWHDKNERNGNVMSFVLHLLAGFAGFFISMITTVVFIASHNVKKKLAEEAKENAKEGEAV